MDPMDPMDWLDDDELLRFFRRQKTEMSCMESPYTFLSQLRDHDLIPEDQYKKVSRMKSKGNIQKGLYEILDWLERERPQGIKDFWRCVLTDTIMSKYPALRLMHKSLMDGSFHFEAQLSKKVETEKPNEGKGRELSDEEGEKQANAVKQKRKLSRTLCDEEEEEVQPGTSSQLMPRKKSKKIRFSPPLKKGEMGDIWTWPIYKLQLPVTCGQQAGTLHRRRLAEGQKCIVVEKQWFTPTGFERFSGKERYKNWKMSIRCAGTPLGKLIQEGHLESGKYKGGCTKAKKSLFPSDHLTTVSEGEEDEDSEDQVSSSTTQSSADVTEEEGETEDQTEDQSAVGQDRSKKVFKVTCGSVAGTLHTKRFASGTCGKSVRTERSWMSPVEFVRKASRDTDASWRRDIKCDGEPLNVLIEAQILRIHSLLCSCKLCKPNLHDLEDEKNDDECCICKNEDDKELVECDHCPRSFHPKCHLPHIKDVILRDESLWLCTFCVFRTAQECLSWEAQEKEAAMSRQISQRMLLCQYLLLDLCSADEEQIFASNPCLYVKDYSTVIKTPMWLSNVADKLQKQLYQTVGEFVSDVQLIFTNCASFNQDNADFLAKGNRLKKLFDVNFNNVFKIKE